MRRIIAGISICAFILCASLAFGQSNGVPASVTSMGPGRTAVETGGPGPQTSRAPGGIAVMNGVPASVTSLGPNGTVIDNGFQRQPRSRFGNRFGNRQRHNAGDAGAVLLYDPWVSYANPYPPAQAAAPTIIIVQGDSAKGETRIEPDGQGGYRILGGETSDSRVNEYGEPLGKPQITRMENGEPMPREFSEADSGREEEQPAPPPDPNSGQATTLVFRDGHREQVHSYIIMRDSLIDLGSQSHRRIPLDQLNLDETRKINGDIGIDFTVPTQQASPRPTKSS
jgi:hypothetical protein